MFLKRIFFLSLISFISTVLGVDKEICDFTDEVCATKAANTVYKSVAADNKSWKLVSIEDLKEDTINANLSHDINYTFTDAYLYGMKNCSVHKLTFTKDLSWYYYLICPRLIFKADYVEKCVVDSVLIESKGKIDITYENNHVGIQGVVEIITGSDGKPHINITAYNIDLLNAKGNVHYNFKTSFSTNNEKSEKSHKYMNDNWKKVNNDVMYPIMKPFIDHLAHKINKVISIVPISELFRINP